MLYMIIILQRIVLNEYNTVSRQYFDSIFLLYHFLGRKTMVNRTSYNQHSKSLASPQNLISGVWPICYCSAKLIENMYKDTFAKVLTKEGVSEAFPILAGVIW